MFDNKHGIAFIAQLTKQPVHAADIAGMHAGAGLVEDIKQVG